MMNKENLVTITTNSINESQKNEVAKMYYQAFSKKFSSLWIFTKDEKEAINVLVKSIRYENGIYVLEDHKVLGFAGLEKGDGYFAPLNYKSFSDTFNLFGASWRYVAYKIYRIFHGKIKGEVIHIDPIVVSSHVRGKGIGTRILKRIFQMAKELKKNKIVLEVVDTNQEAKKLYKRIGFKVVKEAKFSLLTRNAGFDKVFQMEKLLD